MKRLVTLVVILVLGLHGVDAAFGQNAPDRKLLAKSYPLGQLKEIILPREAWRPYPSVADPAGFEQIPAAIRQAYISDGKKLLDADWPPLPASVFLEYARTGNRSHYEALSFGRREQLAGLVLAEAFERKGCFLDQIVNGIWSICEESFWGVPAHMGLQEAGPGLPDVTEPVVDLFAAETGALLAWTYYLLKPELDNINPLIAERMVVETERRILTPFLKRDDWGWMGFRWRAHQETTRPVNNWNPWINSNVLTAALILEPDPVRRLQLVHKAMDSIDNFIMPYPADGGCDEGPSYWSRAGGSLFDCLGLLYSASGGKIDVFDQPLIKKMGRYIYRTYISDPYYINFADASARMRPDPALVFQYGRAIQDQAMIRFAAFVAQKENYGTGVIGGSFGVLNRALPALFTLKELLGTPPAEPLVRDVWLPDIQVMAARSEPGSSEGFYLAAKGGHNNESHNHNDVGNYIVFHDGTPVLIDAGAQTYTAQTFSSHRYELWNNQSAYHTLPTINGVMQKNGREFEARDVKYTSTAREAELSLDIAHAYPPDAQVKLWKRRITLRRGNTVEVTAQYQLQVLVKPFTLNFLTPRTPQVEKSGRIRLTGSGEERPCYLNYDPNKFEPAFRTITIQDSRMGHSWGHELQRIVLRSKSTALTGRFTISVDD